MLNVIELRQAARESRCHVADLLADEELDKLIETIVLAGETLGLVLVQQQWSLALPSGTTIEDLRRAPC